MSRGLGRLVGMLTGIIVGVIICFIAFKKMNRDGKLKTEYDERQNEIRGKGYKIGFWTETIYFAFLMLLDVAEIEIPAVKTVTYFAGFMLGAVVMCTYCIWNGAYFGINNNPKRWTIFLSFFGIFNLALGYMMYVEGNLIENGILMPGFINVLCGIFLIAALVILSIKNLIDAKETEADEES